MSHVGGTSLIMSHVVRELFHIFKIQKIHWAAFRAQVNGQIERYNLVVLDTLSKVFVDFPNYKWDKFIYMLLRSSRSSPSKEDSLYN